MSRVNEALTRATAAAGTALSPAHQGEFGVGHPLPDETVARLWPTEPEACSLPPEAAVTPTGLDGGETGADLCLALSDEGIGGDSAGRLILNSGLEPTSVEQYRRLAARLHLAQTQSEIKLVMVTSALVGEGKTLTAANLALTLSESYKKRVLLIDADLRRPGVHELFHLENFTGLNDGIRSDEDRKFPVIRITDKLSVLTAGRPDADPMSVLSSERMRRMLTDAAAAFEWVIVDTPPVALLSDANLLASLVDTIVLVVRAGVTPLHAIQKAAQAVGRDRVLGVVLNRARRAAPHEYYDYGTQVAEACGVAKQP